jgi:hypothetical protein
MWNKNPQDNVSFLIPGRGGVTRNFSNTTFQFDTTKPPALQAQAGLNFLPLMRMELPGYFIDFWRRVIFTRF